jgi:hypothetical protein
MRWKMGAATTPPYAFTVRGESIITMIVNNGARDGTKPTKETL